MKAEGQWDGQERRAPIDWTTTQNDINAILMRERDDAAREKLIKDVNHAFDELRIQRVKLVALDVLTERVEWLVYAMRGLLGAFLVGMLIVVFTYLMGRPHV